MSGAMVEITIIGQSNFGGWDVSNAVIVDDSAFEEQSLVAIPQNLIPQTPSLKLPEQVSSPSVFPSIQEGSVVCRDDERDMITEAYADLNKVISSDRFKSEVETAPFTETNGLTNDAIYNLMLSKSPVTVDFTMYTGGPRANYIYHTMGYEDQRFPTVCFANRHFIYQKEVCASLILHESMHILGFTHYQAMDTSVPYTMNRIYDKVATALGLEQAQD